MAWIQEVARPFMATLGTARGIMTEKSNVSAQVGLMKLGLPVALLFLLAFTPETSSAQHSRPLHFGSSLFYHDRWPSATDWMASSVGLRPLRSMAIPEGQRELRVWFGFANHYPYGSLGNGFLRIVEADSGIHGEVFEWRTLTEPLDMLSRVSPARLAGDREWSRKHHHCWDFGFQMDTTTVVGKILPDSIDLFPAIEWCRIKFSTDADWKSVLDILEVHRVWTLPDEELSYFVLDGQHLVAESREGARFRKYKYSGFEHDQEGRDADAILDIAWRLNRLFEDEEEGKGKASRPDVGCGHDSEMREFIVNDLNRPETEQLRAAVSLGRIEDKNLRLIRDPHLCRRLTEAVTEDSFPEYHTMAEGCVETFAVKKDFKRTARPGMLCFR